MRAITMKSLSEFTAQEVFEWITTNLLKQNARSYYCGCRYRGLSDTRCAAGWCIADEEYLPEFEGRTWLMLVLSGVAPRKHRELIGELQKIHDMYSVDRWSREFKKVQEGLPK